MNFTLAEEHYLIIRSKKEYGISLNDTSKVKLQKFKFDISFLMLNLNFKFENWFFAV